MAHAERLGRFDQFAQVVAQLGRGQALEAREGRALLQHRRDHLVRIRCFLARRGEQRVDQPAPVTRIAFDEARAERPLVDLGRGEQLVERRREGERRAARVAAGHDLARDRDRERRRMPAEMTARAFDALAPAGQQAVVELDADHLEHRARAGEEQVAAGETTRVVERQA